MAVKHKKSPNKSSGFVISQFGIFNIRKRIQTLRQQLKPQTLLIYIGQFLRFYPDALLRGHVYSVHYYFHLSWQHLPWSRFKQAQQGKVVSTTASRGIAGKTYCEFMPIQPTPIILRETRQTHCLPKSLQALLIAHPYQGLGSYRLQLNPGLVLEKQGAANLEHGLLA